MVDEKLHLDHPNEEPPPYEEATESDRGGTWPPLTDEKTALRQEQEFHSDPAPAYPGPSRLQSLAYPVELHKDGLNAWTISVAGPTTGTWWQLTCGTNQKATMLRHSSNQIALPKRETPPGVNPLLPREIATVQFPSFKWAGPKITFAPHEAETERKGPGHVGPTDRLMQCSGFFSAKYVLDLPALTASRVAWKVPDENDAMLALKLEASEQAAMLLAASDEKRPAPAEPAKELDSQAWSPFPIQHLVEETTGRVFATYSRAAPWAKTAGTLTIPQGSEPVTEEVVEGIVISCAVMVGMQYKSGLFTSLIESGYESIAGGGKGKGRALQ